MQEVDDSEPLLEIRRKILINPPQYRHAGVVIPRLNRAMHVHNAERTLGQLRLNLVENVPPQTFPADNLSWKIGKKKGSYYERVRSKASDCDTLRRGRGLGPGKNLPTMRRMRQPERSAPSTRKAWRASRSEKSSSPRWEGQSCQTSSSPAEACRRSEGVSSERASTPRSDASTTTENSSPDAPDILFLFYGYLSRRRRGTPYCRKRGNALDSLSNCARPTRTAQKRLSHIGLGTGLSQPI